MVRSFTILLTLSFFAFFLAGTSYAQTGSLRGAVAASGWPRYQTSLQHRSVFSVQSIDQAINYYNSGLPSLDFAAPFSWNSALVAEFGERFTLAGMDGFLDSVQIAFDSITADSVEIDYFSDTLYSTSAGEYHLMNIFDPNAPSPTLGYVHASQIHGRTTVTIAVPHFETQSQNFWVGVVPNFNQSSRQFTNAFSLVGDSESIRTRTTDSSRSGFLAVVGGQILSAVFDSTFVGASGAPLYTNFYITAYVSNAPSGISMGAKGSTVGIYPNPVSNILNISSALNATSIELFDPLGREVLSKSVESNSSVDISEVPNGNYEAILRSALGTVTVPVIVQH